MLTVPQSDLNTDQLHEFVAALNDRAPVWYQEKCWITLQHGPHGVGTMAFTLQGVQDAMCGK